MIRPYRKGEDVERLFPVIKSWLAECRANEFGIEIEMPAYIETVYRLIEHEDTDLMVMFYEDEIIGVMGITSSRCPIGAQCIANALYWYTLPEHRGKGISFVLEARRWARAKGCSHIIFSASKMASEMHDRVCQIYEHLKMRKFETSYMLEIS